jgi:hypothetical protein
LAHRLDSSIYFLILSYALGLVVWRMPGVFDFFSNIPRHWVVVTFNWVAFRLSIWGEWWKLLLARI